MSNVQVKFKRGNTSTLNSTPTTDGLIYFNTENNRIYMDNNSDRLEYKNDTSNILNKLGIQNLVKRDEIGDLCPTYNKIDNLIGNSYIGDTIINCTNNLISNKALFQLVWETTYNSNGIPNELESTVIMIEGDYPYYIIFYGDINWDSSTFTHTRYSLQLNNSIQYVNNYNNNEVYSGSSNEFECRRVQINNSSMYTNIQIGEYGVYTNGHYVESVSADDSKILIPYKIIGIANT